MYRRYVHSAMPAHSWNWILAVGFRVSILVVDPLLFGVSSFRSARFLGEGVVLPISLHMDRTEWTVVVYVDVGVYCGVRSDPQVPS